MASKTSTQMCDARLTIGTHTEEGETGKGHGHAEMDALHKFIVYDAWGTNDIKRSIAMLVQMLQDQTVKKVVYCPSKPCCKKCSAVLRQLGFETGPNSSFSDEYNSDKMTEWGVSLNVAKALEA